MENKFVGYLLLAVSALVVGIIFMFNMAMKSFVSASCTLAHGGTFCPMYTTIAQQTYLSLGIVGLLVVVALILIFSKPQKEIVVKKIKERKIVRNFDISDLTSDEKKVLNLVKENKTIFQAELIEKTGFGKAKMTRIIDRLEGKDFVERKRRGMTNVVVSKE